MSKHVRRRNIYPQESKELQKRGYCADTSFEVLNQSWKT